MITEFLDHLRIVVGVIQDLELLYGHAVFLQQILGLELQQIQVSQLLLHYSGLHTAREGIDKNKESGRS